VTINVADLRVQIHSIQGDVDNARSVLSHAWRDQDPKLLIRAGEELQEIVDRISKLVYPRAGKTLNQIPCS
jgi:hypothetical protein